MKPLLPSPPQFPLLPKKEPVHKQHHVITEAQKPPTTKPPLPPTPAPKIKNQKHLVNPGKGGLHPQPSPFLPHTFQRIKPRRRTRPLVGHWSVSSAPAHVELRDSEVSELFLGSEKCALQLGGLCSMVEASFLFLLGGKMNVSGWPGSWGGCNMEFGRWVGRFCGGLDRNIEGHFRCLSLSLRDLR